MEVVLRKMGNSVALVVPAQVVKDMGLKEGQTLTLEVIGNQIVLTPKKKFVLADMIAQCDLSAKEPASLSDWNNEGPAGQELL